MTQTLFDMLLEPENPIEEYRRIKQESAEEAEKYILGVVEEAQRCAAAAPATYLQGAPDTVREAYAKLLSTLGME